MRSPRTTGVRAGVTLACFAGLVAGCSSLKPYPNSGEKNLEVRTRTDSGSMFSSVRAAVHIHRVDGACRLEYQGTVELDRTPLGVVVPVDRASYLVFTFASSSFLGGSESSIRQETVFRPRGGYRYHAEVTYRNDTYHVVLREVQPNNRPSREIELMPLGDCEAGRRPPS